MSEDVPKRKISDFKIPDKAKEELQLISKITGMLAEKPELLKDIGEIHRVPQHRTFHA